MREPVARATRGSDEVVRGLLELAAVYLQELLEDQPDALQAASMKIEVEDWLGRYTEEVRE